MDPNFASDMNVGHGLYLDLRRLPIRLYLHAKDFVALAESTQRGAGIWSSRFQGDQVKGAMRTSERMTT